MRVVKASPLIHLARVSLLDLLRMPGPDIPVVVPYIVFQEVLRGARHDPSAGLVEQAARDWLTIVPTLPAHAGIDLGRVVPALAVQAEVPAGIVHPGIPSAEFPEKCLPVDLAQEDSTWPFPLNVRQLDRVRVLAGEFVDGQLGKLDDNAAVDRSPLQSFS
jgi:hypothetical protein